MNRSQQVAFNTTMPLHSNLVRYKGKTYILEDLYFDSLRVSLTMTITQLELSNLSTMQDMLDDSYRVSLFKDTSQPVLS